MCRRVTTCIFLVIITDIYESHRYYWYLVSAEPRGVDLVAYGGDFVVAYRSDLQQASCGIIHIACSLQRKFLRSELVISIVTYISQYLSLVA